MQVCLSPMLNKETDLQVSKQFWPVFAAGLGLLLTRLWGLQDVWGWSSGYGGWQHSMLELFSANVAFSVFHVGWHAGTRRQTLRGLAFSVTFLSVGLLNLFHLLSLPHMPAFITANSVNKAVLFSYTSHLLAAIYLLGASSLPIRRINHTTRRVYLGVSLLITVLLTFIILFYENSLPRVFIGDQPVGGANTYIALLAICLSLLVFGRSGVAYGRTHKQTYRYMALGAGMWVLSQMTFPFCGEQFDVYSLIGHIYKVLAYWYVYHSVSISAVKRPHKSLIRARERLRQTRRFRTLGRMIGRLAHELKNPLAAIRASAQLSAILDDGVERAKVTRRIEAEVDRLTELVTLTLEIGWERQEIWDLVDIEEMVEEVNLLWAAELRRLGIASKIQVEDGLPLIQGNPKLLQRALTNLVLNAVEAMPGGGELLITAYQEASDSIRVEVSDTGPGIPDELRDQLFREFVTTKAQGTGMGLMITHQIVTEIHRGQIWFNSALGKGTKFCLRLPVLQTALQQSKALAYGQPILRHN